MQLILMPIQENELTKEYTFNIVDSETWSVVGIIFTIGDHVACDIEPEFKGKGIGTEALKIISQKIDKPKVEIHYKNSDFLAAKRIAEKAGYKLVKIENEMEIYEYSMLATAVDNNKKL